MKLTVPRLSLLALVISAGVILGSMIAGRGTADAHLTVWSHTWGYTFGSSSCTLGNYVDPVGVVFTNQAFNNNLNFHAVEHGWPDNSSSTQYFYDHTCKNASGSKATSCWACTRYHFRWLQGASADASWNIYSIATPHYEISACPGHAVESPNGFTKGKQRVYDTFNPSGHHAFLASQYWDNRNLMTQCNGLNAGSNGFVWFIYVPFP
jgi:hypothetical protein